MKRNNIKQKHTQPHTHEISTTRKTNNTEQNKTKQQVAHSCMELCIYIYGMYVASGPSNSRPHTNILAPVRRPPKRLFSDPGPRARTVSLRGPSTRGRKRPSSPSHASDLEAATRLRDARQNPVPPESSQVSSSRRENNQGDATPPPGLYLYRDPG